MSTTKYGVWKTRYTQNIRNTFEDWVRRQGEPFLFDSEKEAEEFMHKEQQKSCNSQTDFEVRLFGVSK